MKPLYNSKGYVDMTIPIHSPASVSLCIGGRGIGKTYGALLELHDAKIPFFYMRRTQAQLDEVTIPVLSPYNQIMKDTGQLITTQKIGKHAVGFYDAERNKDGALIPAGDPFAVGIALSTFANIRGMSAERDLLLFDEIIPERHERPIKEEESAFSNVLESINRNRELNGGKPLKTVLLSNSNTMNSQILSALGCVKAVDKMSRTGRQYMTMHDGALEIFMYRDSPISERKKNTAYYKILQNEDFKSMSLNNDFSASDYEYVKPQPLNEFKPLASINGCAVYAHKSNDAYYVISGSAGRQYESTELERAAFRRRYGYIYRAMVTRRISYSDVETKLKFEEVWN